MINEDITSGPVPSELEFLGYKTKNLHHSEDAIRAFTSSIAKVESGTIANKQAVLQALKSTDQYMKINDAHLEQQQPPDDTDLATWRKAHSNARHALHTVGEFMHHMDYWHMHEHEIQDMENKYNPGTAGAEMADSYEPRGDRLDEELTDKTIKQSDKIKVARVIADMLGVEKVESMSPETAINQGLRQIKNKRMTPELIGVLDKMLKLASSVGVKYNNDLLPATFKQVKEASMSEVDTNTNYNIAKGILSLKDYIRLQKIQSGELTASELEKQSVDHTKPGHSMASGSDYNRKMKVKYRVDEQKTSKSNDDHEVSDEDLDKIANNVNHENDILDVYDDHELALIDKETGEEIKANIKEDILVEVLSRAERMRARARFMRTEPKRMRKLQVVLHRHSDTKTINKRARRLAILILKQRIARKSPTEMTISEKERVERILEKRKPMINRLAMRLVPRIRKIEVDRLTHDRITKKS